ncbi:MAG: SoxR reducing system RseC family protein [Bacteroidales bacterium]|nr:SoxR reducing system RseC family protein [Bacteroidales bacterium]
MSDRRENIEHPGIVDRIDGKRVWVSIQPQSACGNCHSKSYCGMAEVAEKIVEVQSPAPGITLEQGQHVIISLKKSLGYRALVMGYLLPFVILLLSLIILLSITGNEALAALASILLMVPYYLILYSKRDKIKASFRFFIKH